MAQMCWLLTHIRRSRHRSAIKAGDALKSADSGQWPPLHAQRNAREPLSVPATASLESLGLFSLCLGWNERKEFILSMSCRKTWGGLTISSVPFSLKSVKQSPSCLRNCSRPCLPRKWTKDWEVLNRKVYYAFDEKDIRRSLLDTLSVHRKTAFLFYRIVNLVPALSK